MASGRCWSSTATRRMRIVFGLRFAARFLGSPVRQRDLPVRSSSRPLAAPNTNGTSRGLALWRTPKSLRRPRLLPTRTARLIPTDLFCNQTRLALKTRFTISRLRRLLSSAEALQRPETRAEARATRPGTWFLNNVYREYDQRNPTLRPLLLYCLYRFCYGFSLRVGPIVSAPLPHFFT